MAKKKKNRFLDWVNADTDLPTLEELEAQQHHDDHEDHGGHDEQEHHGEQGQDGHEDAAEQPGQTHGAQDEKPAEGDDALEPIVLDEAMQYPDPVIEEDETPESEGEAPEAEQPAPKDTPKQKPMITREQKAKLNRARMVYGTLSTVFAIIIIAALLLTVSELPTFGSDKSPTVNEVYHRYVEQGREDTGAVNTVAGMILDYRAFDTLGESLMLFTATMGVVMLIRDPKRYADKKTGKEKKQ